MPMILQWWRSGLSWALFFLPTYRVYLQAGDVGHLVRAGPHLYLLRHASGRIAFIPTRSLSPRKEFFP